METRTLNEYYKKLAEEVIQKEPELETLRHSNVRIAYLQSDLKKKSGADMVVHGECEKVQPKNQWAMAYDFTVTLYVNNNLGLTEDQLKILLFHELLHVGIEKDPVSQEEDYSIVKHDLEDFKVVIDRYGTDWCRDTLPTTKD